MSALLLDIYKFSYVFKNMLTKNHRFERKMCSKIWLSQTSLSIGNLKSVKVKIAKECLSLVILRARPVATIKATRRVFAATLP